VSTVVEETDAAVQAMDSAPGPRRRRRRWRLGLAIVVGVLVVALAAVAVPNRDLIVAYWTHRVGEPAQTWEVVRLPPEAQPELRVALAGDVGEAGERENETAAAMAAQSQHDPYDILMLLGDNVYPAGDPQRLQETVYEPFAPLLSTGTELFAILGNHDEGATTGDAQLEALGMPGRWYAVERGDMLGIALDSNDPTNPEQLAWLERTLADSDATWKLVGLHHPPYSSGFHGSNQAVRDAFVPLFERYGVQVVFSGHEHDYQRTDPINGVVYIVTGAAARTRPTGIDDYTAVAWSTHHYVDLNIYPDHLLIRAIDQDGEQFDEVTIPATPAQ
jgi:3',5'-cyclic AMP phosphodiesterase CpdA